MCFHKRVSTRGKGAAFPPPPFPMSIQCTCAYGKYGLVHETITINSTLYIAQMAIDGKKIISYIHHTMSDRGLSGDYHNNVHGLHDVWFM